MRWQPVQRRGEFRRGLGRIFPEPRQGFESDHSVMECLAIGAGNGLDGKMPARLRPAGDANAITALGTFEQIGTAHKVQFRCLPSLPQRGSKTKKLRRPIFVEQKKRKVENGLPVFVEIMEGLPSVTRNIVTEKVLLRQGYGGHHPALGIAGAVPSAGWWRRRELNPRPWQTNQPRLHA